MASAPPMLPSGIPDFSCVKDFENEADARIYPEEEPSSPVDTENLPPELRGLEERLQEIRKASKGPTETAPKEDDEEEPVKALYFVRIPKPDFDSPTYDLLQQDFEAQLAQVKIYVEHRRVHSLKKKEARADTTRALECLREANARVKEQGMKLDPYKAQRDEDKKARGALRDSRKSLAASTEAELDGLIRSLEYRIEHETVSLSEEKDLHNQIRRLKASRPRVREHEEKEAALTATMSNRTLSSSDKEHLEKEMKEYKAEQSMYATMYHDLREIEDKIGNELKQICSQLDTAAKKKDAIYAKLADARQRRKMRKVEWQRNRDFSKQIRSLVDDKRVEQAQAECRVQAEILMEYLMSHETYRKEYMTLWSTKRANPMAIFEDGTTETTKTSTVKPVKKKSALHGNLQVVPGQSIADAVVADALREAKAGVRGAASQKKAEKKTEPDPIPVREASPIRAVVKEKPTPKPPQAPAKTKRAVVHDDFQLPAVVADKAHNPLGEHEDGSSNKLDEEQAEVLEKQRLERIEALKKKKADQAKKKKEKEAELREEKAEVKAKEIIRTPPQTKKSQVHPKKPTSKHRGHDVSRKMSNPVARPLKKKQKTEMDKIIALIKQYPILIASIAVVLLIIIIYSMF